MLEPKPAFGQVKFSWPPYCYAALVPHCVLVEILKKKRKIKELTFVKHFTPQPRSHKHSIFFFTLSWTTSSQPLGAGQWIVRSRQFASWATRSTRSDLTKSFYLKQTKLTANLSFWRIICTDKRNMFLLVFFTTVIDLTFFSQMNEKYKSKESAIIGGSTWIGSPAPRTCTCASPLFWE